MGTFEPNRDEVRYAKYSQAFDLYVTQSMSYEKIAKLLGINVKTLEHRGARQHWTRHRIRYQEAEAGCSADETIALAAARQARLQLEIIGRISKRLAIFEHVISAKLQYAMAERETKTVLTASGEAVEITVPTLALKDLDSLLTLQGKLFEQAKQLGEINEAEVQDRLKRINQFQATLNARRKRAFGEILATKLPLSGMANLTPTPPSIEDPQADPPQKPTA